MADVKEKVPTEPAQVEVKLALGEIDHDVHLADGVIVHFKEGVAKVEKAVAKLLKEIGLVK